MRSSDAKRKRDLACRIVRYRPRIVVVRPVRAVIIVLFDLVYFVFRFDVAMLRHADIDADGILRKGLPIKPGIRNRFADAKRRDTPRSRAASNFATRATARTVALRVIAVVLQNSRIRSRLLRR